jgi:hypothetical protein
VGNRWAVNLNRRMRGVITLAIGAALVAMAVAITSGGPAPAAARGNPGYGWACGEKVPERDLVRVRRIWASGSGWQLETVRTRVPGEPPGATVITKDGWVGSTAATPPSIPLNMLLFVAGGNLFIAGQSNAGLDHGRWLTCANDSSDSPMVSVDSRNELVWWVDAAWLTERYRASAGDTMTLTGLPRPRLERRRIPGGYAFVALLPRSACGAARPGAVMVSTAGRFPWSLPGC